MPPGGDAPPEENADGRTGTALNDRSPKWMEPAGTVPDSRTDDAATVRLHKASGAGEMAAECKPLGIAMQGCTSAVVTATGEGALP